MLIGLTGRNAAGKGEVAKYLQTKSFYYYSLSDAIRDELRSRKLEVSRESLIQVGNGSIEQPFLYWVAHGLKILGGIAGYFGTGTFRVHLSEAVANNLQIAWFIFR
jgi:hypothetical protein